jgi:hypothetical protein
VGAVHNAGLREATEHGPVCAFAGANQCVAEPWLAYANARAGGCDQINTREKVKGEQQWDKT